MNDNDFWNATDQLNLIYRWARASFVSPWGLLFGILLRVAASTGPGVMLPGPPAPASLNQAVVFIGRSGAGKGVTDKLSRVVWPADIHEEGLGSGQGIAELFKEQKNPEDRITRAIITLSEIDHLSALNAGQGNNTRATLKAGLTGDRLGSKGASAPTTRSVPADSYRLGLSIGAQFGHTAVLMDDVSGGTPQRLLWAPVTDPDMPDEPGPTPDHVLDTALPPWALSDRRTLIQYGPDEIGDYIKAGLLANARGDNDAIDGHRTLTRLKVAADLAILDHRSVVSELDWRLSEAIMDKSDETRNAVLEYDRRAARDRVRTKAIARAAGEDFYDASRLETVKRSIMRMLERDGEQASADLRRRLGRKEKRDLFDQAIALLEGEGLVSQSPGRDRGTRYRIGGHGDHDGHPAKPQLSNGDQVGHGDHPATVTDIDTRRSPELTELNSASGAPKPSCQKWFDKHIETLLLAGDTTADSFAVYEAGQRAGYSRQQLRTAASSHREIKVISRANGKSTWDITGTHTAEYQSADEWVTAYLDALPAASVVDKTAFRSAASAAGHSWTAARHAATESGRIESTRNGSETIWRLLDDDGVSA
ncbi:hypothetical protein [Mycolicibacterium neoaurum]|uniref:hypothetical protein n=1 Tax=Mycolicibacterium neoaurum TaxID=1795 RepID=UPI001F4D349E|nr:hypothetical protein [Mycolicibacterium neoaurum]